MRFVQLKAGDVRRVALVEEPKLRLLRDLRFRICPGSGSHRERRETNERGGQSSYG